MHAITAAGHVWLDQEDQQLQDITMMHDETSGQETMELVRDQLAGGHVPAW